MKDYFLPVIGSQDSHYNPPPPPFRGPTPPPCPFLHKSDQQPLPPHSLVSVSFMTTPPQLILPTSPPPAPPYGSWEPPPAPPTSMIWFPSRPLPLRVPLNLINVEHMYCDKSSNLFTLPLLPLYPFILHIYIFLDPLSIYKFGLSVCLSVCLFVSNKRQNG